MKIWIDADSCPKQVRNLVYKRAKNLNILVELVANRNIDIPISPLFNITISETKLDSADDHIVLHAKIGDIIITRDILLAKRLVDIGHCVLNDRGTIYDKNNIDERVSLRNFSFDLQSFGIVPKQTHQYNQKDFNAFANAFDRALTRCLKSKK